MLRIEIHQGKVQSVWFTNSKAEQLNSETFKENLQKAGLKESDIKALMSEHRVNNKDGYVIRILGSGDYYECFEYHAGH